MNGSPPSYSLLLYVSLKYLAYLFFFEFFYNVKDIPLAEGILYPSFGILLSPIIAAVAMSCSSVSVIANALRLKSVKI